MNLFWFYFALYTVFIAAIVVLLLYTTGSEKEHVTETTDTMEITLTTFERDNLDTRLQIISGGVSITFAKASQDIIAFRDYAKDLYTGQLPIIQYYPTFDGASYTEKPPGPYEGRFNFYWSFYYRNKTGVSPYLKNASILDNYITSVVRSHRNYPFLFMGFNDGLMYQSPWKNASQTHPYFPCGKEKATDPNTPAEECPGFSPTVRVWYINAVNKYSQNNFVGPLYSDPYLDASTQNRIVSLSMVVNITTGPALGVVGLDLNIQSIEKSLLGSRFLDSGYVYMIDKNGNTIIHPNLKAKQIDSVVNVEFPQSSTSSEAVVYQSFIENTVIQGKVGQNDILKDGKIWTTSYSPINGTDYFILLTVPLSSVVQPSVTLTEQTETSINTLSTILIVICVVIGLHGFCTITISASELTKKLHDLNKIIIDVMDKDKNDLSDSLRQTIKIEEIDNLATSIYNLFFAVKFSTDAYNEMEYDKAIKFLDETENMFEKINQQRALGVIYNNKGTILRRMNEDKLEALTLLAASVKNIIYFLEKERLREVEIESERKVEIYEISFANRLVNFADCLREANKYEDAIAVFDEAYSIYSKQDDVAGITRVIGNRGFLYQAMGDDEKALEEFLQAQEITSQRFIHCRRNAIPLSSDTIHCIQQAELNLGKYFFTVALKLKDELPSNPKDSSYDALYKTYRQNCEDALGRLYYCLTCLDRISKNIETQCLSLIATILENHYPPNISGPGLTVLEELYPNRNYQKGTRAFHFLIDVSPSMSGSRINQCISTLLNIVEKTDSSRCMSLTTFATETTFLVEKTKVNTETKENIMASIFILGKMCFSGRTAFYDALLKVTTRYPNEKWIVALTDGEDNASVNAIEDVKIFFVNSKINLIIIAIGTSDDTNKKLKFLASKEDYFLGVGADPTSIDEALQKGYALALEEGNITMESL